MIFSSNLNAEAYKAALVTVKEGKVRKRFMKRLRMRLKRRNPNMKWLNWVPTKRTNRLMPPRHPNSIKECIADENCIKEKINILKCDFLVFVAVSRKGKKHRATISIYFMVGESFEYGTNKVTGRPIRVIGGSAFVLEDMLLAAKETLKTSN